jgi:hypothetical protein
MILAAIVFLSLYTCRKRNAISLENVLDKAVELQVLFIKILFMLTCTGFIIVIFK